MYDTMTSQDNTESKFIVLSAYLDLPITAVYVAAKAYFLNSFTKYAFRSVLPRYKMELYVYLLKACVISHGYLLHIENRIYCVE